VEVKEAAMFRDHWTLHL